jgi:hypothetical protein
MRALTPIDRWIKAKRRPRRYEVEPPELPADDIFQFPTRAYLDELRREGMKASMRFNPEYMFLVRDAERRRAEERFIRNIMAMTENLRHRMHVREIHDDVITLGGQQVMVPVGATAAITEPEFCFDPEPSHKPTKPRRSKQRRKHWSDDDEVRAVWTEGYVEAERLRTLREFIGERVDEVSYIEVSEEFYNSSAEAIQRLFPNASVGFNWELTGGKCRIVFSPSTTQPPSRAKSASIHRPAGA